MIFLLDVSNTLSIKYSDCSYIHMHALLKVDVVNGTAVVHPGLFFVCFLSFVLIFAITDVQIK